MSEQPVKVLVVEDDANWRIYFQILLQPIGCQVRVATDLDESIEALSHGPYHLAIVDVRLAEHNEKDLSGLMIIKEAWDRQVVSHFLVLSAYAEEEQIRAELGERIPYQFFKKSAVVASQFKATLRNLISGAVDGARRSEGT